MPDAFRISTVVSGLPERVYSAWLDSAGHTAFTRSEAKIDPTIGGKFTAWDGYIQGRTVELLSGRRLVQTWRTKEFPHSSSDSRLEVQFEWAEGGTRITILHSNIPDGQGERYKKGWSDNYFNPMKDYFARLFLGPSPGSKGAAKSAPRPSSPPKASAKASAKPALKKPAPSKAAPKKSAKKPEMKKPSRQAHLKSAAKRPAAKAKTRKR